MGVRGFTPRVNWAGHRVSDLDSPVIALNLSTNVGIRFCPVIPTRKPILRNPVCLRRRTSITLLSMLETMHEKSTRPQQIYQGLFCRILEPGFALWAHEPCVSARSSHTGMVATSSDGAQQLAIAAVIGLPPLLDQERGVRGLPLYVRLTATQSEGRVVTS